MHKISFTVPPAQASAVKNAMFRAGAGQIGDYKNCYWECLGQGHFHPLLGAQPAIGRVGESESLPELRIEMVCSDENLKDVLKALVEAHPYETPAYGAWPIITLENL
ncbi:MAG: NGG1p interacting factor NIF3 [Spirochaetales bacterium]|nr:NGG1p interacting factor NIF3 [Spirochaetales bacterium]